MQVATNTTATTAITAGSVAYVEAGAGVGGGVAIGCVPSLTALAAGETVTVTITRLDTGAIIGQSILTNEAAGASSAGPIVVVAPIPTGMAGALALNIQGSVATGNVVASATMPITLVTLP